MHRSYLFAPGHNARLLGKVFDAGADAVMLDLEDAVPPEAKDAARAMVAKVLAEREGWVRINAVRTATCEADLDALAGLAAGIRIPKVESAEDAQWVAERARSPSCTSRGRISPENRHRGRHWRRLRRCRPGGRKIASTRGSWLVCGSGYTRSPRSRSAFSPSRYQSGIGTPKYRWRLTSQSPLSPSTQWM